MILASAASHKVRAPAWFRRQVADYRLLPEALHGPAARALPLLEGALALALLWPATRGAAALAALALVALYAAAIGINLARGRHDLDCGCAGPGAPQPLHPGCSRATCCSPAWRCSPPPPPRPARWACSTASWCWPPRR